MTYDELVKELKKHGQHETQRAFMYAFQETSDPVKLFAIAILHGDDTHKAWLLEAAEAFCHGWPMPEPRDDKQNQLAASRQSGAVAMREAIAVAIDSSLSDVGSFELADEIRKIEIN